LKQNDSFLDDSLEHLGETNVVDLLLKLIACDEIEVPTITWFSENNLISRIFQLYETSSSPIVHENASQLLSGIIVISAQNISAGGDCRLLRQLEEEDVIDELLNKVLVQPCSSVMLYGCSVIIELLKQSSSDLYDFETPANEVPTIVRLLAKRAKTLNDFLHVKPEGELQTSFGSLSPPLGSHRLKIIDLISSLITARYVSIYNTLLETPIFSSLMELFFEYHWNNFLHYLVSRIFTVLLESNDSDIVLKFLELTKLHSRLAKVGLEETNSFHNSSYQRRGYMGFVTNLANSLQLSAVVSEDISQLLNQDEEWLQYLEVFKQTQEIQSKALGGIVGAESSEEEELDQMIQFQHIVKRDFENDFPQNFAVGDFEDKGIHLLVHPADGNSFVGILCEEPGFGQEFDFDEEN